MSEATNTHEFSPADEQPIPPWPSPQPPPSKEDRVYVVGMRPANGDIQYYFVERPELPDRSKDGPLEIRVPTDCKIILQLDSAWNWEFRHENAVMLGPMKYPEFPRYFNLVPEIVNNRCQKVQFNALYLNVDGVVNRDPYCLYINLDQRMADGTPAQQLVIRIDPDIDNPGSPHQ